MKRYVLLLPAVFGICASIAVAGQPDSPRITKETYIATYRDHAISNMMKSGVPASITLAQGILESEFGNSYLARKANNHFGIKCHSGWKGRKVYQDDDKRNECFRRYKSASESFDDHSDFLRTRQRYAFLFDLKITDYKGWARGLKKAGYATNPSYAGRLIRIIEEHRLHELDRMGANMPVASSGKPAVKPRKQRKRSRSAFPAPAPASYKMTENNVPFVTVREGETYYSIAKANHLELWQVFKYNDADIHDILHVGDVLYVKPKRKKARQETHVVIEGETMRDISQLYAVKLKKLYRHNDMRCCQEPKPGQVIKLK